MFVLFEVIRLLKLVNLLLKSGFFTKLPCFNLLNSWVVIYLELSGILFSTYLIFLFKTVVVSKLLGFGILFSTSLVFAFKMCAVAKALVSGIFLSPFPIVFP